MSPYGLFGRKQAFNGNGKEAPEVAKELFDYYRSHSKTATKMADAILAKFIASGTFADAKTNCRLIEELAVWKPEYKGRLREAVANNDQIKHS